MTRRDYELIAESIRLSQVDSQDFGYSSKEIVAINETYQHICENLASALQQDNPRFDGDRFLKACGIE